MKKLLALILALSMVATLVACSPKGEEEPKVERPVVEDDAPVLPEEDAETESEDESADAPDAETGIGSEEVSDTPEQPDEKPVEQKPVEKPVEQKPVETQKPTEQKPAVTQKPVEQKPAATQKPVEQKPAATQKPAEQKPAVTQKPAEQKPAATQKPVEQKPAATQKPVEQKPAEKPVEQEKPAETPKQSPAQTLRADFKSRVGSTKNPEVLASALIENSVIPFMGAAMAVEPGYLSGFDNEISGFSKGAMFGPVIGTIPFVGYIFEVDANTDVNAFVKTLKDNANLRWNICTSADEMVVETSGNIVFFVMAPAEFTE